MTGTFAFNDATGTPSKGAVIQGPQRWGDTVHARCRAVWLVDEPYEVDDTAAWSQRFDLVFLNDAATLARHRHAHALPMAYDPVLYHDPGTPRPG